MPFKSLVNKNLVSIQQVKEIVPIPGADRVVKYRLSENVYIGNKDKFKVNQLALVIKAGVRIPNKCFLLSFVPSLRRFRNGKIRNLIVKESLSDCVAIPTSEAGLPKYIITLPEGTDLTDYTLKGKNHFDPMLVIKNKIRSWLND